MPFRTPPTPEQALQKLKHFCAYQERCHSEVIDKLYKLGVRSREHDALLAALIEEDYLNEERFAIAFAGGKWRIKHWGRERITWELKQKKISDYCIRKALKQIDAEEYTRVIKQLAEKKYSELKNEQHLVRKKKTADYLRTKGFESGLIAEVVREL